MNDVYLLWVAIIVFILLVIGLALTVYEFKTYIIEPEDIKKKSGQGK